ncbi:MAG: outer membrane beta-barrel protein [Lysobacteraceae bacterium]
MKKKILFCALLGAMGVAQAAIAHEFDDRWYVSGAVGYNIEDQDRVLDDAPFFMLGVGKFFSRNWSVDLEFNYQNPNLKHDDNRNWEQYGLLVAARYNFVKEGRNWWPYIKMGLGAERSREDFVIGPPGAPITLTRSDTYFASEFGVGLQADYGRVDLRGELGVRFTGDDNSVRAPSKDYFSDFLASVGVTVALGPEPVRAVVPEPMPVVVNCADLDDDGDGVNNCNDLCPGSQAGQTIGPDGCPVPEPVMEPKPFKG